MRNRISFLAFFAGILVFNTPLVAQTKTQWVVPAQAALLKNPFSAEPSALKSAKILYISNCSPCHGQKGRGDGAAAASLNPKPADHSSLSFQSQSDGAVFYKITEGKSPMPSYKTILTDQQRWSLVTYIRSLKKN